MRERYKLRDALDLRSRDAKHPREVVEDLASGREEIEIGILDDAADAAHRVLELMALIETADGDVAGRRLDETDQHPDRGRLARSVWSQEAEDFAPLQLERNGVDDRFVADDFREIGRGQRR